jgi:xanthine dehydrogenase small subunit
MAQLDGSSLVTVDALGEAGLSPVQTAMVKCHGSQCGYCTPGFVILRAMFPERFVEWERP